MMSDDEMFKLYVRAWRAVETAGAFVHYDGCMEPAGYFHPHEGAEGFSHPTIAIRRPYYAGNGRTPTHKRNAGAPPQLPPPDIGYELITLAHEYGHLMSWKGRTPRPAWDAYNAVAIKRSEAEIGIADLASADSARIALRNALTDDERALILAEEELAWRIGRELLQQVGFHTWDAYEAREREGMHFHRYRLGIEDAWPSDAD